MNTHEELHNKAIAFMESQFELNKAVTKHLTEITDLINHANELIGILMRRVAVLEQEAGINQ